MGTIAVSLPADGTTAEVADYNTPITTIVDEINGGLDNANIATGAAIAGSKLADASVTNAKLSTTAGDVGGAWATWVPTFGNFTEGSATVTAKYTQIGKTVIGKLVVTLSGSTVSGDVTFTLPVTSVALAEAGREVIGDVNFIDNSASAGSQGQVVQDSTTVAKFRVGVASTTYLTVAAISATVPFTWANSDVLACQFTYEAA